MTGIYLILALLPLAAYFMLGIFIRSGWKKSQSMSNSGHDNRHPSISVVVAARNEIDNIDALLISLSKQNYDDFEVIIIDDDSSDGTKEKAEEFCAGRPNFTVITAPENVHRWGPKKNALHAGISAANGEIILTTDADCRPEAGWVDSFAGKFSNGVGAVAGFSPIRTGRNLSGRLKTLESLASAIISAGLIGIMKPYMATGRNLAYRRDLYLALGGFGESGKLAAGDDDLLLQRIHQKAGVLYNFDPASKNVSYEREGGYIARKRRHFSVAGKFPVLFVLMGLIVIALQLEISIALILGFALDSTVYLAIGIFLFAMKMMIDLDILRRGAVVFREDWSIQDFVIAEFIQIPYSLILQPVSFFGKIKWRGRKL